MEGVLAEMVVWEQPCSLVWWMALTEAGLWPYRGEIEGKKGERGRQTRSLCTLRSVVLFAASSIWPKH